MKIIIYNRTIGGHHLEYIHHLYMAAIAQRAHLFYIVLPKRFEELKDNWTWPFSENIHFILFNDGYDKKKSLTIWDLLQISWNNIKIINHYANEVHADKIYCNTIIELIPFAPFLIRRKIRLLGIVYRIYLYDIGQKTRLSYVFDKVKFWIMSRAKVFETVFILNDRDGANRLNKLYHTRKFLFLPDPYIPLPSENLTDFRRENGIPEGKKLFVQFGALNTNKSTIEILESIRQINDEECGSFAFAFVGVVYEDIKLRFYEIYNELKDKVQIIVKDEYCSYKTFASLCIACDAILTPYRRTAQSSGLIGYAAQFHKPVIAPDKGLLGSLVKSYGLGLLISDISSECLTEAYRKVSRGEVKISDSNYCVNNSVEAFQNVVFNSLIHSKQEFL